MAALGSARGPVESEPRSRVRLTIAIPTLNRARDLRRAIDSALAQSSPEIKVLVSNNGSTRVSSWSRTRPAAPDVPPRHDDSRRGPRQLPHRGRPRRTRSRAVRQRLSRAAVCRARGRAVQPHPNVPFVYTRCFTHVGPSLLISPHAPELEDPLSFLRGNFSGQRSCSGAAASHGRPTCGGSAVYRPAR